MEQPHNRVFSGVQPTGNLHLGNYLGAIRNFVALQETHECIYCVVDMHAITLWQDPKETVGVHSGRVGLAAASLVNKVRASERERGRERETERERRKRQREHDAVQGQGRSKDREKASVGLYAYPVLMAADILAYRATHVPVGDDQKQHLELARDTAQKFNNDFGAQNFFPLPEPLIMGPATRVMSLRDGTKKMSKSDPSDLSRITMRDSADDIARKIRKAQTDPDPLPEAVEGLKDRAGADNLVGIYAALAGISKADVLKLFPGAQFSVFKPALADLAVEKLSPITNEMKRLMADPAYIDKVLAAGAERARAIADPVVARVKEFVGFI